MAVTHAAIDDAQGGCGLAVSGSYKKRESEIKYTQSYDDIGAFLSWALA